MSILISVPCPNAPSFDEYTLPRESKKASSADSHRIGSLAGVFSLV